MRFLPALLLCFSPPVLAQQVSLPTEVKGNVGAFVVIRADTADPLVKWYGVDAGLNLFPGELLRDSKVMVVTALTPGRYRVLAVSAKDGLPSDFAECVVTIGSPPPVTTPPVVTPPVVTPETPPVVVTPPVKATSAVYVYEKDQTAIPSPVLVALNKLNRQGILATVHEQDTTDGTGDTPEQYKVPLAAAKQAGIPVLVVMSGKDVLRVVRDPRTEAAVMEAIQ